MDSLLANYASSDEDEREEQPTPSGGERKVDEDVSNSTSKPASIFNSLPPPKASLFNSLPPPKSQSFLSPNPKTQRALQQRGEEFERDGEVLENPKPKSSSSSSLFSSLPAPKSSSSSSSSKRVVQFRPPTILNPSSHGIDDENEEDDEDEKERQRKRSKESASVSSAAFSLSLPAPRHSANLGALPLGAGRRSMVETDGPPLNGSMVRGTEREEVKHYSVEKSEGQSNKRSREVNSDSTALGSTDSGIDALVNSDGGYNGDQYQGTNYEYPFHGSSENYAYYSSYAAGQNNNLSSAEISSVSTSANDADPSSGLASSGGHSGQMSYDYSGYGTGYGVDIAPQAVDYSYGNDQHVEYADAGGSYENYANNAQYENNWVDPTALPEASGTVGSSIQFPGKKGGKDVPPQIVEVNQDELMKNRPRQDQVKMTGIAFGPAYQPAPTKGKPTKLHKRKHQIGSLYFEMRQKEMELAERRAQGFKTKAETQSKYGW